MSQRNRLTLLAALFALGLGLGIASQAQVKTRTRKDSVDLCQNISPNPANVTQFYEDNPTYKAPQAGQENWQTATPESQGLSSTVLDNGLGYLQGLPQAFSFLVYRNGVLVYEKYLHESKVTASNNVHSASKSIIGAMIGIAIQQGYIQSIDQPIADFLSPKFTIAPDHQGITIRHLQTMTAGLDWIEDTTENTIQTTPNWVQAILSLPLKTAPGTAFNYDTGLTHLLSAVLTEATGMTTCTFATKNLLQPLGATVQHWGRDPQGYYSGGYNTYLAPRELMKFGILYLQGGAYNGQQVVPAAWVTNSTSPHVVPTDQTDPTYAYGLNWWLPPLVPNHGLWKMWGYGGQFVYVVPSLNLVAVTTANTYDDFTEMDGDAFVNHYVLPAVTQ